MWKFLRSSLLSSPYISLRNYSKIILGLNLNDFLIKLKFIVYIHVYYTLLLNNNLTFPNRMTDVPFCYFALSWRTKSNLRIKILNKIRSSVICLTLVFCIIGCDGFEICQPWHVFTPTIGQSTCIPLRFIVSTDS